MIFCGLVLLVLSLVTLYLVYQEKEEYKPTSVKKL